MIIFHCKKKDIDLEKQLESIINYVCFDWKEYDSYNI